MRTTIKMDKQQLLEKVTANRNAHRSIFEKAVKGYREAAIEALETLISEMVAGRQPELYIRLPRPEDHTSDYDVVISMLEASVSDVIEVAYDDYRMFVLDEWGWKDRWVGTTSSYLDDQE